MNKIKDRRNELVMTQAELAEASGVSLKTVVKIETGKIQNFHPKTLRSLATVLGWVPAELYHYIKEAQIGNQTSG